MTKLIEVEDGLWVQPSKVAAVKRSGLESGKCTIFMSGQSAVDGGFLVDEEVEDVIYDINKALEDDRGGEDGKGKR